MSDTSLRRNITVSAVLGLLLLPGCQAVDTALTDTEAIGFASVALPEQHTRTVSVEAEHSTVSYRYPVLGQAHPLTIHTRTAMAQRQTAFLEESPGGSDPKLTQDVELLGSSEHVTGLRLKVHDSTAEQTDSSSTLWYDAHTDQVLPWTSLFKNEQALGQAHLDLAEVLRSEYDLTAEELPGLLGEIAARAEAPESGQGEAAASPTPEQKIEADSAETVLNGPDTDDTDVIQDTDDLDETVDLDETERLWKNAESWDDSPLADLAFSTAGGLAVRMAPEHIPDAEPGDEILVPIAPEVIEPHLSELGHQARDAAVDSHDSPEPLIVDPDVTDPGVTLECQRLKCVALTFDDGPGEHTDELLDHLAEYDAKATFYVLGSLVKEFPEIVERTATEGHEVANHTWAHADLTGLSAEGVRKDLERTDKAIEQVTGRLPVTMRPPYGSLNDTVREASPHPLVLWDVDTMDWRNRDTKAITRHALKESKPGSVVLFHDIHKTSVDALPEILEGLHRQGYHFVTVEEMFGLQGLPAGEILTDARID